MAKAKAKDKSSSAEEAAAANGSNGAAGNPDTGQLLDKETMDELSILDLDPGGPTPSKSILKVGGSGKEIANQFKQEEEVIFKIHARCEEVGFKGDKRVHHFDVLDIFQDDDLDADLVERFKDRLEAYGADAETTAAIEEFLNSCLDEDGVPAAEEQADEASPSEEEVGELDLSAEGAETEVEGEEEVVDGVIVDEDGEDPEAAALEDAAKDLDWSP